MWVVWLCLVGALHLAVEAKIKIGIIGGVTIDVERVPYMVSLRSKGEHWCGGSIVSENFILTAAHCILPNNDLVAVVGSSKLDGNGDAYSVKKALVHPNYSTSTNNNDAALLHLTSPIVFKETVKKIDLADKEVNLEPGTLLTIAGWGKTETADISNDILIVEVPYIPNDVCQKSYSDFRQIISDKMMCAGKPGKDSCAGDSGGPLVHDNLQLGITSFGLGCGSDPGVYTKVSAVIDWISKTIQS